MCIVHAVIAIMDDSIELSLTLVKSDWLYPTAIIGITTRQMVFTNGLEEWELVNAFFSNLNYLYLMKKYI